MDPRIQAMYQDPRIPMMGQSDIGSVPGSIPMNYAMGNPTHANMGIQEENALVNFSDYSQLPVRKEVDEEGRICGVVLSKPAEEPPAEENDDDHHPTEENNVDHLPNVENGDDPPATEEVDEDEIWKDSKENIKTEEQDDISIFMDTAHDIFLKISSKEMKIQEASNILGRPYSFVYSRYQEFLDNITGKATMKKKKKGSKTKRSGKDRKAKKGKSKKSGGRFKCEECPAAFHTEYLIKTHTKLHTENIESHLCTACGILFPRLGQLMRHRMETHDDALQCPHCEKQYTKISAYKFHVNTHTKTRPFVCDDCGKGFFSKVSLEDHHRQHTGERPFMCGYCEKTFVTLSNLKLHSYIHIPGGRPNKPKRKKQPKPPKKYECQECGSRYISRNKLYQHMNTHTGATPFACELCDARFSLKPNLIRHKRKHTGEKPFKCNHCTNAFAFASELRLHDMVHTGDKPFKCKLCDYACVRQSKLDYHMNTHTGEKPFKCDFYGCNAEYPSPSTLKQHKLKHGPAPFKVCKICNDKFPDINSLKRHMMIHPGNEPLPCNQCDKIFYNESTLKRHMHVHMYKRPENKPKVIRTRKKNPPIKRPDPPMPPITTEKRIPSEYQAPFAAVHNGHSSISQSWTINAEDTNSQPQQSYYHPFPTNQYTNLNGWPATFDPDELRNRLLASFK